MKDIKSNESGRHLESLMKGLEVLNCIERSSGSAMTLSEIADATGLYKSRVMRVCGTLEHMGYLIHDRQNKLYRLGSRLLSLGRAYERNNPLILTIKPSLDFLNSELNVTASFYILRGMHRVCVARVGVKREWEHTTEGEERELHYGSTGKVFLAFGPQSLRESFFSQEEPYTKLTPFTLTTSRQVWDEVRAVREKGYAESFEERVMGLAGLAAPVYQVGEELAGVVSVAGNIKDFGSEKVAVYVPFLLGEAGKLSRKLGFYNGKI